LEKNNTKYNHWLLEGKMKKVAGQIIIIIIIIILVL